MRLEGGEVGNVVLLAQVEAALENVIDPELAINVVDLGMVQDVQVDGDCVVVSLSLTSMSCPFWGLFVEQVKAAVGDVAGVAEVDVRFDRTRPWSPELMSEPARTHLEAVGLMPPRFRQPRESEREHLQLIQLMPEVLARRAGEER
jgi:metal-sulfur cluster biosynthetic enzyme